MSSNRISLQVTVHIDPSNLDKFLDAFKPVYEKVVAEPQCTFFELYQDPQSPGTLSWVENWSESKEWLLQNQVPKDYYREYFAITEPMYVKPRELKLLHRLGEPLTMVKRANGRLLD